MRSWKTKEAITKDLIEGSLRTLQLLEESQVLSSSATVTPGSQGCRKLTLSPVRGRRPLMFSADYSRQAQSLKGEARLQTLLATPLNGGTRVAAAVCLTRAWSAKATNDAT